MKEDIKMFRLTNFRSQKWLAGGSFQYQASFDWSAADGIWIGSSS